MKPGKHQEVHVGKSKDHAQSYVLIRSYTMHKLGKQRVPIGWFLR